MRRLPLLACLALVTLISGCLDPSADPPTEDEGASADDFRQGRTGRGEEDSQGGHYENSFSLTVNPDSVVSVSVGGVTQGNCVLFWDTGGADYVLRNGTATLEWDAVTPLADELSLYVAGGTSADASAQGPSPLTLSFESLAASGWGLGFASDTPLGSLAVQQPVTLSLAFDYERDLPGPGIGSCSNGI